MEFLNLTYEEMKDILIKLLENLQLYCDKQDELKYRSAISHCYQQNKNLNKGIDELLKKYENIYDCYTDKKFGEVVIYKQILQDLKNLKGE